MRIKRMNRFMKGFSETFRIMFHVDLEDLGSACAVVLIAVLISASIIFLIIKLG